MRCTVLRHSREVSSTLALSTEQTFRLRLRAASNATRAMRRISASLGDGRRGLYEPIHGSAPDIAGQGVANPVGAILSAALLLRHSLGLEAEAVAVEAAVEQVLRHGPHSRDIGGDAGTDAVRDAVIAAIDDHADTAAAFFCGARACG